MSEIERLNEVDRAPQVDQATEPDEEWILRNLYGDPDVNGIYRGAAI